MVNVALVKRRKLVCWSAVIGLFILMLAITAGALIACLKFLSVVVLAVVVVYVSLPPVLALMFAGPFIRRSMKCREPRGHEASRLERLMAGPLAETGLSSPPVVYVSDVRMPNAFAFGTTLGSRGNYVAVTSTAMTLLDDAELEAVLGHELGHLKARDTLLMTIASVAVGMISHLSWRFRAMGLKMILFSLILFLCVVVHKFIIASISRFRELAADAHAALVTGHTQPLISAFEKIEGWYGQDRNVELHAFESSPVEELLLTHPKMGKRTAALRELEVA